MWFIKEKMALMGLLNQNFNKLNDVILDFLHIARSLFYKLLLYISNKIQHKNDGGYDGLQKFEI